jgi:ubiquinol-cytochrome c reductase cytochrome c1 subunit
MHMTTPARQTLASQRFARLVAAGLLALTLGTGLASPSFAAGDREIPPGVKWSFSGPFGTFDRAQLQRGLKVFKEACSTCHSANLLAFRNLSQPGGPGFTDIQIKNFAADFKVKDGPNEQGEMFERPARPADRWPSPHANEQAARAANGGALPPDFSVLAKARGYERGFPTFIFDMFTQYQEGGPDYIAAVLKGYEEPPKGTTLLAGQYWNKYMPGNLIAMPKPLSDGQIDYPKGPDGKSPVPETVEQYAKDVTSFMMWVAEPHLEARKKTGLFILPFLLILATMLYYTKKRIWSRLPEHAHGH